VLLGLVLAVSLRAAHELVGAGVLPAMARDLGGEAWAGAFFAVYGLAGALGILLGGRATDARGPAATLGFGLCVFAAGMLGTGLAGSMPVVVAARSAEGFGGGLVTVVVSAVVIRSYDAATRPRVLAWLSAAWVVPGLVAPALAVAIAEVWGWRWVFLGLLPLVGLAAALVIPPLRGRSAPAAVGASVAPESLLAGARGAALAVRAAAVFAFFGVESFLPLSLAAVRSASAAEVAALLTLSALAWTAGACANARASRRVSAAARIRAGTLGLVTGIGCASLALLGATPISVALAGWTLAGLGMGVAYTAATASAMDATRAGGEGAAGAALGIVDAVASSAATALGGVFLAAAPLSAGVAPLPILAAFGLAAAVGSASLGIASRLASPYCFAIATRASAAGSR
jgi:predicted MFS family arabinose efflux permease